MPIKISNQEKLVEQHVTKDQVAERARIYEELLEEQRLIKDRLAEHRRITQENIAEQRPIAQEKKISEHKEEIKKRPVGRPKKILTEEEQQQRIERKKAYDRERFQKKYQAQKQARLEAGAPTVYTEEELRKRSLQNQKRYEEDEEFRNYMKAKALESYRRKQEMKKENPEQKATKKMGRPRKHIAV